MRRKAAPGGESAGVAGFDLSRVPVAGVTQPLAHDLRTEWEPRFGRSLAGVRIASDAAAAEAADAVSARAFTVGSSIWFGRGEYQPHTADGQRLLAHELAHVVQASESAPAPTAKLRVGSVDDPAEHAADRAADAVLRGERAGLAPAAPALRRQPAPAKQDCTGSREGPLTAKVMCGDKEYRVTGSLSETLQTKISAVPNIDATNVSLTVKVCRGGNEIRITPSVNLPKVAQDAIGNAVKGAPALSGVTISPRAEVAWTRSESVDVSLTGGPDIDPSTGRASGGRIGAAVDTGKVRVGAEVILGPDGKPIGGGATVGSSQKPVKKVDCWEWKTELAVTCETVTRRPGTKEEPGTPAHDVPEELSILFEYAKPQIRKEPEAVPSRERLDSMVALGAKVESIEGFASPEGPLEPKGKFQGNMCLSQQRAAAAAKWLRKHAPELVPADFAMEGPTTACRATDPRVVGHGELYSDPMTREEVGDFVERDPLRPTDPITRAAMTQIAPSAAKDAIYPKLRRALIHLKRTVAGTRGKPATPGKVDTSGVPCPDNVAREARRVLRS